MWLLCAEAPAVRTSDQEAADNDDDFPEQSPEEIAQMVQTDKYAVVGGLQLTILVLWEIKKGVGKRERGDVIAG